MKMCWTMVVVLLALGCGKNNIIIDIDLPLDQTSPFVELVSAGGVIYFEFAALLQNATSIDDIDPAVPLIRHPSGAFPFLQPDKDSYVLDEVVLDENRYYRVTLFGTLDVTEATPPKYRGRANCPLKQALGSANNIVICFGLNSPTDPVCADTIPFTSCPAG